MFTTAPNTSLFPEIDFASKCLESMETSDETANLLSPLNNADSGTLRRRLRGRKFYVRDIGEGQVAVTLSQVKAMEGEDA